MHLAYRGSVMIEDYNPFCEDDDYEDPKGWDDGEAEWEDPSAEEYEE